MMRICFSFVACLLCLNVASADDLSLDDLFPTDRNRSLDGLANLTFNNKTTSVYLRFPFELADLAQVDAATNLALQMKYDDPTASDVLAVDGMEGRRDSRVRANSSRGNRY